ncbi:hypothetical protein BC940DRAFT_316212 [Gongronella butleri]|nr:hypothetical protein BC940DRAFT_316212 [Gongronella butleri]
MDTNLPISPSPSLARYRPPSSRLSRLSHGQTPSIKAPMENMVLHLAAPKSMPLKMSAPSSQEIPPQSQKAVFQEISLHNPKGQPLRLRYKATYEQFGVAMELTEHDLGLSKILLESYCFSMRALSVLVFTVVGSVLAAPAVELSRLFDKAGILGDQVTGDVERTIDDSGAAKPVATACNITAPQFLQQYSQCLAKDCAYKNIADVNVLQVVCYVKCHLKACGAPLGGSTDNNAGGSMSGDNPTAGGAGAIPGAEGSGGDSTKPIY